jgi:hypothetical protein
MKSAQYMIDFVLVEIKHLTMCSLSLSLVYHFIILVVKVFVIGLLLYQLLHCCHLFFIRIFMIDLRGVVFIGLLVSSNARFILLRLSVNHH